MNKAIFTLILLSSTLLLASCESRHLRAADIKIALRPINLVHVKRSGDRVAMTVNIPKTDAWLRIIRTWGSPEYVIAAQGPSSSYLLNTNDLEGISILQRGSHRLTFEKTTSVPYGYSADCIQCGVKFRASPGESFEILVDLASTWRSKPYEILVVADWGPGVKDRIVGSMLAGK